MAEPRPDAGAICVVGVTAPDWMEFVTKGLGRNIKHRLPTHIFTHWLIVVLVFTLGLPKYWDGMYE